MDYADSVSVPSLVKDFGRKLELFAQYRGVSRTLPASIRPELCHTPLLACICPALCHTLLVTLYGGTP